MDTDGTTSHPIGGRVDAFDALTRELTDLDYLPGDTGEGITTFAHPDGGKTLATIDRNGREAQLCHRDDRGDLTWMLRLSADVPAAVQILTLYVVLHAGVADEKAIVRSVADALDVPLDPA